MPSIGDNRHHFQQTEPQKSGTFWKKVGVGAFYVATAPVTIALSVIWTGCAVAHGLVKRGHFTETFKHDMKVLQTGLARPLKWLKTAPKQAEEINRVATDAIVGQKNEKPKRAPISEVQRKPAASFEEAVANMLKELDLNSVNEKLGKNARGMKPLLDELKNYPPVAGRSAALKLAGKLEELAVLLDNRAVIPDLPAEWMHEKSKEIRQLVSALLRFGQEQAQAKPSGPQETDVSQHTESVQNKSKRDEQKAEMRNLMIETLLQMTDFKRAELDKMDDKTLVSAANGYIESIKTGDLVAAEAAKLLRECIDVLSK